MVRYFFHLRDGPDTLLDPEGRAIQDENDIPELALSEARSLMAADIMRGELNLDQRLEVEDENGRIVHCLPFSSAVKLVTNE